MSAGWLSAISAVVSVVLSIVIAAWKLSGRIEEIELQAKNNKKGIDSIEKKVDSLTEDVRVNAERSNTNERAIHDHLLQVEETENSMELRGGAEQLCPFCIHDSDQEVEE